MLSHRFWNSETVQIAKCDSFTLAALMLEDGSSSDEDVSAMLLSDPYYRKYAALRGRCLAVDQVTLMCGVCICFV